MSQADEARQIRSLEDQLIGTFGHRLDKDTIRAEIAAAVAELADARVRTFVPVLVLRRATDRLRGRTAA